jgi:hypothetical protein
VPAGCKTSGLLFLGEFAKEETSEAASHLSGQGWSSRGNRSMARLQKYCPLAECWRLNCFILLEPPAGIERATCRLRDPASRSMLGVGVFGLLGAY